MADDIFERLKAALAERYRLDRLVGQGGMATVYLALDLKHHRQVAIKVLRPDLSAALGAERFLREIELAAKLQHPHIVPVYDSGNADGILYYVMPFVEGESLRDLLRREQRVPIGRAAEIVRAAASGLAYAHGQGIVHRDVKPENIMLSGGHAVVTDFGIARAVNASRNIDANLTGAGMAMGTPAYMSPEQATADEIDGRTDQYALACVFYEMVSGQQAFSAPTMQAMLTSILTGPRPRLSSAIQNVTPAIDAAVQRALATDPAQRFGSITAFADAVAQESSGAAVATRESRRWKKLAIGLPVLVAALAAVYVAFFAGPPKTVVSGAETIAVLPFSTSGPGLEGLDEGMVDLLAVSLNGVGAIRTIEARAVINEWRKRVKDAGTLDDALAVARSSKAASVLMGSIISSGGTARLSADLYDLDGKALAHAQVSGPAESVLVLADSLALTLLHEIWRSKNPIPSANGANITSSSMPAIRAYLRGESFHRRGEWDSAFAAFQEATLADSTFSLAWYRLSNTLGWTGQYQSAPAKQAAANAEKYSVGLTPRLRSLMVINNLFAHGDVSAMDSAVIFTRDFPNDLDGWFLLGESQYHTVGYRPLSPADLRAPFDRVLAIDSSLTPGAVHPMELALQTGDTALLRRYEAVFRRGGDSMGLVRIHAARDFFEGQGEALETLVQTGAVGQGATRAALFGRLNAGFTAEAFRTASEQLVNANVPEPLRPAFLAVGAALRGGAGQMRDSRATVEGSKLPPQAIKNLLSFPLTVGIADSAGLVQFDAILAAEQAGNDTPFFPWLRALVAFDQGNFDRATTLTRDLLASPVTAQVGPWFQGATMALNGLALVGSGDTLRGMSRADSGLRLIGGTTAPPFTQAVQLRYAQVEVARPATRSNGINRLRYSFTSAPELLPVNTLRIAKAYESAEYWDSAAVNYRRFLTVFTTPDSNFAFLIDDAKAGLQRVTAEKASKAPVGTKP